MVVLATFSKLCWYNGILNITLKFAPKCHFTFDLSSLFHFIYFLHVFWCPVIISSSSSSNQISNITIITIIYSLLPHNIYTKYNTHPLKVNTAHRVSSLGGDALSECFLFIFWKLLSFQKYVFFSAGRLSDIYRASSPSSQIWVNALIRTFFTDIIFTLLLNHRLWT